MTYRIDMLPGQPTTLRFQGVLGPAALAELERHAAAGSAPLHLVLLAGTEVEPPCLAPLLRLCRLRITAESPYLARLLTEERR